MFRAPLVRHQHVDLAEACGRASMAHGVDLTGLALSVVEQAVLLPVSAAGDGIAGLPKIGRARLIGDKGNHAAFFAALDLPERVASELEVVALLIDGVTAGAFDQNAVVDAGD